MRTLLFAFLAVLLLGASAVAEQAATTTPPPAPEKCVTEASAVAQLQGAAKLAAYLQNEVARQYIKLLPPLPAKWKLEDFRIVQIWAFPDGRAFIVLFGNDGCVGLTANASLNAAMSALSKVQRDV